jgi:hypothetical protein
MADSCKLREIHFKATNFIKKYNRPYVSQERETNYVIFEVMQSTFQKQVKKGKNYKKVTKDGLTISKNGGVDALNG